jgi:rare lipoprotein A
MPVLARVTNLENGKSIIVRVNDRGPFAAGREIDMSKHAAELLGFMQKGTAKVRVQYVGRAPLEGGIGDGRGVAETFVAPPVETPPEERQVAGTAPVTKVATVSTTALAAPVGASSAPPPASDGAAGQAAMKPIPDNTAPRAPEKVDQVPVSGPGNIYVQAGSFQNLQNAESVRQQLAGVGRVEIQTTMVDGTPYYRVRVGPLSDVPAADSSLQNVIAHGHKGARIVVD